MCVFWEIWKPMRVFFTEQWGGALELYPVLPKDTDNPDRPNVPAAKPTVSIPVRTAVFASLPFPDFLRLFV